MGVELFLIKRSISRSPSHFRILLEEAGVDPNSSNCDLINHGSVNQHLRYVKEEDVQKAGCADEAEVHCVKRECHSAVDQTEFENGSMVRVIQCA